MREPKSILNYWYRALSSPLGIELIVSDFAKASARLYAARQEAQDTDLDQISISPSRFDPMKLWLLKKRRPTDATP